MSDLIKTFSLLELADMAIDKHKSDQAHYPQLDKFSKEVFAVEKLFAENKIPKFSYEWKVRDPEHGEVFPCLVWEGDHFSFIWKGESKPFLKTSAHTRRECYGKFYEFLHSYECNTQHPVHHHISDF